MDKMQEEFRSRLLQWHADNPRELPWKADKDPYKIWLSEIILQQTRVAQGTPYYLNFVRNYPTVFDLAAAPIDDVLRLWQGLGYYSRARNLHTTAKTIVDQHSGLFPNSYKELIALKGIGPYTAAAILTFAWDEAIPVVDGNVIRVVSRIYGIEKAIDLSTTQKTIQSLAGQLLDKNNAAEYNQAIMNFGAIQCKPSPLCSHCSMQSICIAFDKNIQKNIPLKSKKIKRKKRYFHYLDIGDDSQIYLQQRTQNDIWKLLYEPILVETDTTTFLDKKQIQLAISANFEDRDISWELINVKYSKQILTHQVIMTYFYKIVPTEQFTPGNGLVFLANRKNLSKFAFSKTVEKYLAQ